MFLASQNGHCAVVNVLLAAGCNVNLCTKVSVISTIPQQCIFVLLLIARGIWSHLYLLLFIILFSSDVFTQYFMV